MRRQPRAKTSLGSYIMIILAAIAVAFMAGRDAGLGPLARLFERPAAPDTAVAPTAEAPPTPAATRPGASGWPDRQPTPDPNVGGGVMELVQPGQDAMNMIVVDNVPPVINDIVPDAAPAVAPAYNAASQAIYNGLSSAQQAEFHAPPATPTAVPTLAPQVLPTAPASVGYCGGRSRCAPNPTATPGIGR